jgi:hypothetical protein
MLQKALIEIFEFYLKVKQPKKGLLQFYIKNPHIKLVTNETIHFSIFIVYSKP